MKKILVAMAIGALALAPLASQSTTLTANMAVTGTVIAACSAFSATALTFPATIAAAQTNIHPAAQPTISYTCVNGFTATSIGINGGLHCTGGPPCTARFLQSGVNTIGYFLYSDATFATEWGDGGVTYAAATPALAVSTGVAKVLTVYAQIPGPIAGAQATGAYTDTLVATLTF